MCAQKKTARRRLLRAAFANELRLRYCVLYQRHEPSIPAKPKFVSTVSPKRCEIVSPFGGLPFRKAHYKICNLPTSAGFGQDASEPLS